MRMQTYRLSLSLATADVGSLPQQVAAFEQSLQLLRRGDPERPLFVPWDDTVRARFTAVERDWAAFRRQWDGAGRIDVAELRAQAATFVARIDVLVDGIEAHMSRWTALQHLLQTAVLALAVAGGATLLLTGYRFVLEPVLQLKQAIERLQGATSAPASARAAATSSARWRPASTSWPSTCSRCTATSRPRWPRRPRSCTTRASACRRCTT